MQARGGEAPRLLFVPRGETELRRVVLQETRSVLLDLLKKPRADGKPGWTVQDLARRLGFTAQNIHHHLKILEEHGLARVVHEEQTNGLARQYWATDVEHVYTDMAPDAKAALAMEKALAHHARDGGPDGYFDRHFEAMAHLGVHVGRDHRQPIEEFYRRESAMFQRELQRMEPLLRDAAGRHGVGEAKSALHFAAIASFSEAEFEAWVEGLRLLRRASSRAPRHDILAASGGRRP